MTVARAPDVVEARYFEDEHRRLRTGLSGLQQTVLEADRLGRRDALERLTRVVIWLRRDLLPHAAWEDAWLFPRLDREAGSPWTTRALRTDHQQIRELAIALDLEFDDLNAHWNQRALVAFVAALARLDAIVTAHLAQEDRFVLPLLDEPIHESVSRGGTQP
jgi:iron-sulfur cluster repair protein YtfE (RIC family)